MPTTEVQLPVDGWAWGKSDGALVLKEVSDHPYPNVPSPSFEANAALLRRFAKLARTEAGFLHFANRYGNLGINALEAHPDGGFLIPHETFDQWCDRSSFAAMVIDLWDRAGSKNQRALEGFFVARTEKDVETIYWKNPAQPRGTERSFYPALDFKQVEARRLFEAKNLPDLAREAVISEVETAMNGGGHPRLEFTPQGQLVCRIDGLWCQMWHQFALEVNGQRGWIDCAHCGDAFYMSHDSYPDRQRDRKTRKYCSEKCKNDHNNAKKARDREKVR